MFCEGIGFNLEQSERVLAAAQQRGLGIRMHAEQLSLLGGAALAAAALAADGVTVIRKCRHIERGYEDICRDLREAGADIRWTDD